MEQEVERFVLEGEEERRVWFWVLGVGGCILPSTM